MTPYKVAATVFVAFYAMAVGVQVRSFWDRRLTLETQTICFGLLGMGVLSAAVGFVLAVIP